MITSVGKDRVMFLLSITRALERFRFPFTNNAWDRVRYLIMVHPGPSINYFA